MTLTQFGDRFAYVDFGAAKKGNHGRALVPVTPLWPGGKLPKGCASMMDLGQITHKTETDLRIARAAAGVKSRHR